MKIMTINENIIKLQHRNMDIENKLNILRYTPKGGCVFVNIPIVNVHIL